MDQLVFKKIRAAMGGRVRFIVSGGAPLAPHVEDFCNVALGPLLQVGGSVVYMQNFQDHFKNIPHIKISKTERCG